MHLFFDAAINNIYKYGDTDVFPFPIENRILFDRKEQILSILCEFYGNFEESFAQQPPNDIRSLVPVHHSGFRWATQLDPLWNSFFLGCVISLAERIEEARLSSDVVFSYRIDKSKYMSGDLFDKSISWNDFMLRSNRLSEDFEYVVICDIADCYSRISHHKLDNALRMIDSPKETRFAILKYIQYLTETRSSGLPVGGPAARLLSELSLNNSDRYLRGSGVSFLRYADDYHIFCNGKQQAYEILIKLHRALDNEGLSIQKSKTRIVTRAEFKSVSSVTLVADEARLDSPAQRLMSLSLRYDPYSANAIENYEKLKEELDKIDIIALLNEQLSKTRIHFPTTKKIIGALRHLDRLAKYGAALSMLENMDALYPIASTVFISINEIFDDLDSEEKEAVCGKIRDLYSSGHEVMGIESHVSFAIRVIGKHKSATNEDFLHKCFDEVSSPLVRRDIIMIFSNWANFSWLSIFRANFGAISDWERRAFILASYSMVDEGKHWRDHVKSRFSRFELVIRDWRSERASQALPI